MTDGIGNLGPEMPKSPGPVLDLGTVRQTHMKRRQDTIYAGLEVVDRPRCCPDRRSPELI